jgi:hypothetical protein
MLHREKTLSFYKFLSALPPNGRPFLMFIANKDGPSYVG